MRGVRDVPTVEFIRSEAMKLMDDMEPAQCVMLLAPFKAIGSKKILVNCFKV